MALVQFMGGLFIGSLMNLTSLFCKSVTSGDVEGRKEWRSEKRGWS